MGKREVVQPLGWARPRGYSNGVVAEGRFLFVAGQVGWDARASKPKFPKTFAQQFDLALGNFVEVVRAGGGAPEQVAQMTVFVTDKGEYLKSLEAVGAAWRRHMGRNYPAMALVEVAALVESAAKVEIQGVAVL